MHQKHTEALGVPSIIVTYDLDTENGDVDSKTKMIKRVNSNGLLIPVPPWSTKDPSHKKHKKKKKKKLIDSTEKINKHRNKNDQRVKSIYLEGKK